METTSDVRDFVAGICERLAIPYAIGGSMAAFMYGDVRFTRDVDVVVALATKQVNDFVASFPRPEFYLDRAAVDAALRTGTQFNVIHPTSGIKIDVYIASDELARQQLARARRMRTDTSEVRYSPPEELICRKMQYYLAGDTDRHLRDVVGMLYRTDTAIDYPLIEQLVAQHGLGDAWAAVLVRLRERRDQSTPG